MIVGTNYVVSPAAITGFNITTLDACMDKCVTYNNALDGTRTFMCCCDFSGEFDGGGVSRSESQLLAGWYDVWWYRF
jgi:hypothetical protein